MCFYGFAFQILVDNFANGRCYCRMQYGINLLLKVESSVMLGRSFYEESDR